MRSFLLVRPLVRFGRAPGLPLRPPLVGGCVCDWCQSVTNKGRCPGRCPCGRRLARGVHVSRSPGGADVCLASCLCARRRGAGQSGVGVSGDGQGPRRYGLAALWPGGCLALLRVDGRGGLLAPFGPPLWWGVIFEHSRVWVLTAWCALVGGFFWVCLPVFCLWLCLVFIPCLWLYVCGGGG